MRQWPEIVSIPRWVAKLEKDGAIPAEEQQKHAHETIHSFLKEEAPEPW